MTCAALSLLLLFVAVPALAARLFRRPRPKSAAGYRPRLRLTVLCRRGWFVAGWDGRPSEN